MDIRIRDYEEKDLDFVQKIDFLMWLQVQYNKDYIKENIFTAIDESENVVGIGSLSFHCTWYSMDMDIMHKLKYDIVVDEESKYGKIVKSLLMDKLIERCNEYKAEYSNKKICICGWCEADKIEEMQFLIAKGFAMSSVIPVLKYDLSKEIRHYEIPKNIVIEQYPINENAIDKFIEATAAGNNGIADSKAELWFRTGGSSFKIFAAIDNGKVVSSVTLWNIDEERSATENIFTIPEYRRKNIAREVIATGLQALKDKGGKIATLSVKGENLNAIKLYLSMGYELMYNLIEMQYYA